ncbi:hypothetical protein B0T24DRAFT_672677 [Lasiosphaeria ovina]|uniref:Uncharacterized protein n=1 Tax=Lasiosphaeria ovina TaxID=92902 RepID=A0AAE0NJP9_9PEZI|nr:hypothetical protein B0T24DRAFT_672677 [Lasiosphaeria ovina]
MLYDGRLEPKDDQRMDIETADKDERQRTPGSLAHAALSQPAENEESQSHGYLHGASGEEGGDAVNYIDDECDDDNDGADQASISAVCESPRPASFEQPAQQQSNKRNCPQLLQAASGYEMCSGAMSSTTGGWSTAAAAAAVAAGVSTACESASAATPRTTLTDNHSHANAAGFWGSGPLTLANLVRNERYLQWRLANGLAPPAREAGPPASLGPYTVTESLRAKMTLDI